jgi:GNAT superfamily N-acetyltransferase
VIEIREPKNDHELEKYFQLRYEILRKPQGLQPGSEQRGDIEQSSTHLLAMTDGRVVGATAMVVGMHRDGPSGERHIFVHWRNMAIAPDFQRTGLGAEMYEEVERRARALGAKEIIGNARTDKLGFFHSLGFVETGPGEDLMGISHTSIVKPLQ